MYIMLPKQMESVTEFGIRSIINTKIDKDAKEMVSLHEYRNVIPKKSRRFRSAFTTEQVNCLEKEFQKFPYVGITNRKEIAEFLNISEKAVKIWFQNRRMREKKENGTINLTDNHTKSNLKLGKEQNNNNNNEYGSTNKLPNMTEKKYSNGINKDVSNEYTTNAAIFSSSQNKPKHFENVKIPQSNKKYDTSFTKADYKSDDRFSNMSPVVRNNAMNATSSAAQRNMSVFYDHPNRTPKYYENKNRIHPDSQQIRDLPQDLSSKKRLTHKSTSSNQQYVPVNLNSDQNCLPMYNYCTKPLPIGAAVRTGIPVPTGPTLPQGNIIWNPVNMLPGLGFSSASIARNHEIPSINQNTSRSCSCNCHEPSQSHSAITGYQDPHRPKPQYLLAIPLNSACNQL